MRRVVSTFSRDADGRRAAIKESVQQAERLVKMGLGKKFGVYVDRTLPKGHKDRMFAPWAVWIVERPNVSISWVDKRTGKSTLRRS